MFLCRVVRCKILTFKNFGPIWFFPFFLSFADLQSCASAQTFLVHSPSLVKVGLPTLQQCGQLQDKHYLRNLQLFSARNRKKKNFCIGSSEIFHQWSYVTVDYGSSIRKTTPSAILSPPPCHRKWGGGLEGWEYRVITESFFSDLHIEFFVRCRSFY